MPQTSILVAIIEESTELGACMLDLYAPVHRGYYITKNTDMGVSVFRKIILSSVARRPPETALLFYQKTAHIVSGIGFSDTFIIAKNARMGEF